MAELNGYRRTPSACRLVPCMPWQEILQEKKKSRLVSRHKGNRVQQRQEADGVFFCHGSYWWLFPGGDNNAGECVEISPRHKTRVNLGRTLDLSGASGEMWCSGSIQELIQWKLTMVKTLTPIVLTFKFYRRKAFYCHFKWTTICFVHWETEHSSHSKFSWRVFHSCQYTILIIIYISTLSLIKFTA